MDQNIAANGLQKWEFIVTSLVLLILLLVVVGKSPDNRRLTYDTVPEEGGPYPYFSRVIFDDSKPLDVAILGSSLELVSLNPRSIELELEKRMHREINIALFASNWRGEDLLFFLVRDLLSHRKVNTVVIGLPHYGATRADPHPLSSYWWPLSEVSTESEPGVIALATAGFVRRWLVNFLPPKRVRPSLSESFRGGIELELGFMGRSFTKVEGASTTPTLAAADTLHTLDSLEIDKSGIPLNDFQKRYLKRIVELAAEHRTKVALLSIPTYEANPARRIVTRVNIEEVFPRATPVLGITPAKLWGGRPRGSNIDQFYYDDHLNANGSAFFSHQIVPAFEALLR